MRFLIDNMLSAKLTEILAAEGHDAVHVRDLCLASAEDEMLLQFAKSDRRVIISADRDFGTLLAELRCDYPSVIFIRSAMPRVPNRLAQIILANLPRLESELLDGCIVVFEPGRIRIRKLPVQ